MIKSIKAILAQDKEKFKVPRKVQDLIPLKNIWPDGIFKVGNKFSKSFRFSDINYLVASREDKESMFLTYSELLNSLDSGATTKITINNHRLNRSDFEESILMPMKQDGLDEYRKEYNDMFSVWISKLSKNEDLSECLAEIARVKGFLDEHLTQCRDELIKKLTAMFMPGYQGGLSHSVIAWYKKLPDSTKQHVFDTNTNALLSAARSISAYDDEELLDELVSIFASIAIEDWNDATAEVFIKGVSDAISRINEYVETKSDVEQDGRLTIAVDGILVEKTFATDTITPLGKTAFNNLKSVFEEYNDALEPDEQLAILAKLIDEIIH